MINFHDAKKIARIKYLDIHMLWQMLFFVAPIIALLLVAFGLDLNQLTFKDFSTENFSSIAETERYKQAIVNTLIFSSSIAFISMLLAFLLAIYIEFHVISHRLKILFIFLLALPYFSNIVVRFFSLQLVFQSNGLLDYLLSMFFSEGNFSILYSKLAVYFSLLTILVPISTLLILLSMSNIDKNIVIAAKNLGARNGFIIRTIYIPLSSPGITLAFSVSFIYSCSDFLSQSIIGGGNNYVASLVIRDRIKIYDWGSAAATSVSLGIIVILILFLTLLILKRTTEKSFPTK